jgi:hypothetical protein
LKAKLSPSYLSDRTRFGGAAGHFITESEAEFKIGFFRELRRSMFTSDNSEIDKEHENRRQSEIGETQGSPGHERTVHSGGISERERGGHRINQYWKVALWLLANSQLS